MKTPPENTRLLCSYNGEDGRHAGHIVAYYKFGRFYSGLYPINRVTGWREIPTDDWELL